MIDECKYLDDEGCCTFDERSRGLCENRASCYIKELLIELSNCKSDLDSANDEIENLEDEVSESEDKVENIYRCFDELIGYVKDMDRNLTFFPERESKDLKDVCYEMMYLVKSIESNDPHNL